MSKHSLDTSMWQRYTVQAESYGPGSIHSYFQIASIAFLYYDYLLTLAAEVSHIWPQPISLNIFLFFLNRYLAVFGNIVAPFITFTDVGHSAKVRHQHHCASVLAVREALIFVNQAVVSIILAVRTVALYNCSRAIICGVVGFAAVMAVFAAWSMTGQHHTTAFHDVDGCHFIFSQTSTTHLAATWLASALLDVFIFTLTLMRTLKIRKVHNVAISVTGEGLFDIFLRDGAMYFAVMALSNLANIFTLHFGDASIKSLFATPASCIAATLCSRLVLNLYEAATPGDTDSDSPPKPTTNAMLTSRIELG